MLDGLAAAVLPPNPPIVTGYPVTEGFAFDLAHPPTLAFFSKCQLASVVAPCLFSKGSYFLGIDKACPPLVGVPNGGASSQKIIHIQRLSVWGRKRAR